MAENDTGWLDEGVTYTVTAFQVRAGDCLVNGHRRGPAAEWELSYTDETGHAANATRPDYGDAVRLAGRLAQAQAVFRQAYIKAEQELGLALEAALGTEIA